MDTARKTRKLPEQIADKLREMIIQEEMKTGSKLPAEAELMVRFSVSRSTVREAVKILQTEHIVDIRQGQGTFLCAMPGLAEDPLGLRFADQEELIAQLLVGLITSIPTIIAALPTIFAAIIDAFSGVDWAQLGKDIINGIINGLASAAGALWRKMKEIVRNALKAGKDEAEVGSPSRLFAREIGQWIPAGIAMGAEENTGPLDRTMRGLVDGSLSVMQDSQVVPAAAGTGNETDRIIQALQGLQLRADVSLEGDARKLFRVVRNENNVRTKATNYNALAAGV